MTTDLLYVVGGPPDAPGRDELRYSLRSVEQNLNINYRDVVIVGDVPDWFAGVKMPLTPRPEKFANQRQSLAAYVNHPGAADTVVVLNDDMYVTEPIAELVVCRNKNRASTWLAADLADTKRNMNSWHRAVIATATWVAETTDTDPRIYECHTPLLFDTKRLRDALAAYPTGQPFAVGELYPIAGAGPEGEHRGNAKCARDDSFADKLALDMPYLSGSPGSWPGELGAWAKARWPEPCRWETESPVRQ